MDSSLDWNPPANIAQAVRIYTWLTDQGVPYDHMGLIIAMSQGYASGPDWIVPAMGVPHEFVTEEVPEEEAP